MRVGGAGYLSRGMEKSRKVATSSGVWFRASRVMACRAFFLAWGRRTEQSCRWMAWPRLATYGGSKSAGQRIGLRRGARPYSVSLRGRGPALVSVEPLQLWSSRGERVKGETRVCPGKCEGGDTAPSWTPGQKSQSEREAAPLLFTRPLRSSNSVQMFPSLEGLDTPTSLSPAHTRLAHTVPRAWNAPAPSTFGSLSLIYSWVALTHPFMLIQCHPPEPPCLQAWY